MRVLRVHQAEIVMVILFIILTMWLGSSEENVFTAEAYTTYDNYWNCMTDKKQTKYDELPEEVEDAKWVMLSKSLTDEMQGEEFIGFYTTHQEVEAYVGGIKIYEKETPRNSSVKSPGKCWNFIRMKESYEGKKLIIKITNCYGDKDVKIPKFFKGAKAAIIMKEVRANILAFMLSIILLVIGIIMIAVWSIQGKRIYLHRGILWLGFFTVQLAVWSGIETHILQLMFAKELLIGEISYMSTKLMICPAVRFIQITFKAEENKFMNGICMAGSLDFMISFLLQVSGMVDYEQTMWITYVLGIVAAGSSIALIIHYLIRDRKKLFRKKSIIWCNIIGLGILGVCIVADGLNYSYQWRDDRAVFTRIGLLIYIVILILQLLSESAQLIKTGRKAQAIKEEAEQDGLTKLKNRKSFEEEMVRIPVSEYSQYSIVMFDLNDMKQMNDLYGHSMGDCYIITGSEIIKDVFGEFGEIYRIGGDEFCLISDSLSGDEYARREKWMCDWMASLRGAQIKDFMKIASGYAKYEPNRDVRLWDVQERADKHMYQRKKEMKKKK